MMDFMITLLGLAWKALGIVAGWLLLKYIVRNGTGTIREIMDTIVIGIRAMGHAIRKKLLLYLKREEQAKRDDKKSATAAYNDYLKKCRAECMSFEEFVKANDGDFTID